MWLWHHHVIILLVANLQFALADMVLLHLGPIIFGGSDKIIAYLRSHGLLYDLPKAVQGS